jgi:hypothetical protein
VVVEYTGSHTMASGGLLKMVEMLLSLSLRLRVVTCLER